MYSAVPPAPASGALLIGDFCARSVGSSDRPLLNPLFQICFIGTCLVTLWFQCRYLIGDYQASIG